MKEELLTVLTVAEAREKLAEILPEELRQSWSRPCWSAWGCAWLSRCWPRECAEFGKLYLLMAMRSGHRIPLGPVRSAHVFTVVGESRVGRAPERELPPEKRCRSLLERYFRQVLMLL